MIYTLRFGAAAWVFVCAGSAFAAAGADLAPIQTGLDYHSFANVEQFRVTHVELNLRVDFVNKVLFGEAALEIKRLDPRATELVLDTRDLDIRDVSEKPTNVLGALSKSETTWVSRPFHLDKSDPILGSPLVIELPPLKKSTEIIKIEYVTSPSSPALQWLTDKQTAGRHHAFMYTMSSPIGARSWIPLQDTPQVRATYSAVIHTDSDVVAVMSAKNDPKVKHNGQYSFVMSDAIPSNLISLAVGDLRFKETGPRTGVYAEKPLLADAAKEFADTAAMLQAAEKLFGPYRWDRFDVVVLPRSFPDADSGYPNAPFISPSALTGDRSLESVVVHALAQSWAGELVSGSTWRDAWINQGFAIYMQDRLVQVMYGEPRAAAERAMAWRTRKAPDQALAVDLRGKDPGVLAQESAGAKAGLFFEYLDAKFGRARFDEFMRGYFDHFALRSVTTEQFLAYLKDNLLDRSPNTVTGQEISAWVTGSGVPTDAILPASDAYAPIDAARAEWLSGKLPAKKLATKNWVTQQWLYFLAGMPPSLRKDQLGELDQTFDFTRSTNDEVCSGWLLLVIRNTYQPGYPRLEQFLETTGRETLIVPLYVELVKTPAGATLAKRVYALSRPLYFSRTAAAIDPIVNPASESGDDE